MKERLHHILDNPQYQALGQDSQISVVRKIADAYRTGAKRKLIGEFPELRQLINRRKQKSR